MHVLLHLKEIRKIIPVSRAKAVNHGVVCIKSLKKSQQNDVAESTELH